MLRSVAEYLPPNQCKQRKQLRTQPLWEKIEGQSSAWWEELLYYLFYIIIFIRERIPLTII